MCATTANGTSCRRGNRVDQMSKRTSQPIQFPDYERVAWPQLVENLDDRGPLIDRTAGGVNKDAVTAGRR